MKNSLKKFCKKCAYYKQTGVYGETCPSREYYCLHPENWKSALKSDATEEYYDTYALKSPFAINENNDCGWWERRRLWNYPKRIKWLRETAP